MSTREDGAKRPGRRRKRSAKPPATCQAQAPVTKNPGQLSIEAVPGKTPAELMAESTMSPIIRGAALARTLGGKFFGDRLETDLDQCVALTGKACMEVRQGNLNGVTDTLTAQMAALDSLFTALLSRGTANLGQYPEAADRYMNMALRAQANCRVTAEALAKIRRGGSQTVKVVHVHEGGQAVVADTVHSGGAIGGRARENPGQPDGKERSDEEVADVAVAALLGQESAGPTLHGACDEGKEALPAARREVDRGA